VPRKLQSPFSRLLGIIGVSLGIAVLAFMFSCLNTAINTIHIDLKEPLSNVQWMNNAFGILIASTLVICGRLADLYGKKRVFLIGLILLFISQLGVGLSSKLPIIVFFQAILGISGGSVLPISQALLLSLFPKSKAGVAIAIWACVVGIALGIGPVVAGTVIRFLNWHWIFLINAPIAAVSFFLTLGFVPKSPASRKKIILDWWGMLFIFLTIVPFTMATVNIHMWQTKFLILLYGASAVFLIALLIVEKKVPMPIIQEHLFTHRRFITSSLSNFCMLFFVWASLFILPLYLQKVLHYSPFDTGLILLAVSAPMAILSPIVNKWAEVIRPRTLILIGFALLIASSIIFYLFQASIGLLVLLAAFVLYGIGWGLIWNPTITAALSSLSSSETGVGAGTFTTIQEIGGVLGLTIIVGILASGRTFIAGYHNACILLLGISILGFIITLFIPKAKRS